MTVDRKRKQGCEWCGSTTNQYDGVTGEFVEGLFCSDGCKDEALMEKQAECDHFTAVNVEIVEDEETGYCEECGAEVVRPNKEGAEWTEY